MGVHSLDRQQQLTHRDPERSPLVCVGRDSSWFFVSYFYLPRKKKKKKKTNAPFLSQSDFYFSDQKYSTRRLLRQKKGEKKLLRKIKRPLTSWIHFAAETGNWSCVIYGSIEMIHQHCDPDRHPLNRLISSPHRKLDSENGKEATKSAARWSVSLIFIKTIEANHFSDFHTLWLEPPCADFLTSKLVQIGEMHFHFFLWKKLEMVRFNCIISLGSGRGGLWPSRNGDTYVLRGV